MKTIESSTMQKIQVMKDRLVKGCKKVVKLFAKSYQTYCEAYGSSPFTTWYSHPYRIR